MLADGVRVLTNWHVGVIFLYSLPNTPWCGEVHGFHSDPTLGSLRLEQDHSYKFLLVFGAACEFQVIFLANDLLDVALETCISSTGTQRRRSPAFEEAESKRSTHVFVAKSSSMEAPAALSHALPLQPQKSLASCCTFRVCAGANAPETEPPGVQL